MKGLALALTLLVVSMFSFALMAAPAHATQHLPLDRICSDPALRSQAVACLENDPQDINKNRLWGPDGLLTKVIRILSLVVGIVSIFVIIIAGVTFMTSGGDSSKVNKARESIMYAAIGLVVVAFSQGIVIFVLNNLK